MSRTRHLPALPATAFSLWLLSSAALQAQTLPRYRMELLVPAGTSMPGVSDMNQAGAVVGRTTSAGNERGWIAAHGQALTLLPLPPGRISSWANRINDQGVIAGTVSPTYSPEFNGVAALWTPNGSGGYTVEELGILPGCYSSNATALNNVGDIVGYSFNGMYRLPTQFIPGGTPVSLASTGIFDPQSVNDARVVVDRTWNCMLLDLNTMQVTILGVPPTVGTTHYTAVTGSSINASGQVSGSAILSGSAGFRQAARYTSGVGWEMFGPAGSYNGAADMNDQGELTMVWGLPAVVQLNGLGTFVIEDLIDAPVGHWYVFNFSGWAMNNARQLVGPATNTTTNESGLLLLTLETPVGNPLCFGDGNWGACPCANFSLPGANEGCLTSGGTGAILEATGSDSVAADDLVLRLSEVPAGHPVVFVQGGSFTALPFRDGLRCAGAPLIRLEVSSASASGLCFSAVSIVTRGSVVPGMTCVYQGWFRDNAGPCGSGSNISSGVQIVWQ